MKTKLKKPSWYTGMYSLVTATDEQVKEYFSWVDSLPPTPPKFENNRYSFKSRYNEERYFELENGEWFFGGENLNDYIRVGYKETPDVPTYIDGSGGPFLEIGSKFRTHVSVLLEHDLQITGFKNENGRWKLSVTGAKETKGPANHILDKTKKIIEKFDLRPNSYVLENPWKRKRAAGDWLGKNDPYFIESDLAVEKFLTQEKLDRVEENWYGFDLHGMPPKWLEALDEFFVLLEKDSPEFRVLQNKLKYGSYRGYFGSVSNEAQKAISLLECVLIDENLIY